ncbi:MAG: hypothetical protein KBG81_05660 [Moraxellaceae bacterium]|nr:hypothetical protein [Moraxellaceae bacterium]
MKQTARVELPDDLEFSDLKLCRKSNGKVGFDWGVIERIAEASDIPMAAFTEESEDNVCGLILGWYRLHREHQGEPDPVAEALLLEAAAEGAAGQNCSHTPGRA